MNDNHGFGDVEVREPRIRLVPFEDIMPGTESAYLIKGLIPRVGLTVVWGPPKSGKSFWTFDVAMHIALGWEYRDRRVKQGPVVYVACEGAEGFKARIEAWRQRHLAENHDRVPFYLVPASIDLIGEHMALITAIKLALGTERPAAIVLDTLNRSLVGSESKDEDMSAYVQATDAIREAFGCTVVLIHHCGIDGTRPRGHTSLTGACDAQLAVKRDSSGIVTVEVEYMKDGAEGETIGSRLEVVEVGTDQDNEAITSCIIDEADTPVVTKTRLTPRQRRALEVLGNALADYGKSAPEVEHYPAGAVVVEVELWRECLFKAGVLDVRAKNPRADFKRLRESLAQRDQIREWNGLMWVL